MKNSREFKEQRYPFYHLNKNYPENPGLNYWKKKLKLPLKELGFYSCSQGFLALQLFPYKTKIFRNMEILPSFAFTKMLLMEAIRRDAIVIQMYSATRWENNVPELKSYKKRFTCRNYRTPTISPKNIGDRAYLQVIDAIKKFCK